MNEKANIQCNKLMKMDDTMVMYGIYNAETLEKLIETVHKIHNTTVSHERLFAGKHNLTTFRIIYAHSLCFTTFLHKLTFISKNHSR